MFFAVLATDSRGKVASKALTIDRPTHAPPTTSPGLNQRECNSQYLVGIRIRILANTKIKGEAGSFVHIKAFL